MINWILFALIGALQALDIYTTWRALQIPGNIEANKIMARLMAWIGVLPALIATKLLFLILLAAAVLWTSFYGAQAYILTCAMGLIVFGYALVVGNNLRRF